MISIISAIYKSDRYLEKFLSHVQKFAVSLHERNVPFEFILVHTQSSPKELELMQSIKKEPWFKTIVFDELGVFGAWNAGVHAAHGDIMGFWNADDIRFPEAAIEAEQLVREGTDIVYFPFRIWRYVTLGPLSIPLFFRNIAGKILHFEKRYFETSYNCGPHFMFTKKAYEIVGPFDEQFRIAGDFDWCARAAYLGLKFALTKNYSGIFRVDGHGMSAGKNARLVAENNVVYRRQDVTNKIKPESEYDKKYYPETIFISNTQIPFTKK